MRGSLESLFDRKISRYLVCGVGTAAFNLALLVLVIEGFGIASTLGRTVANFVCTEISVLFSFFVYKIVVWRDIRWGARDLLGRQLPMYHASVATAFFVRTLVVFPLLDTAGIHYAVNLLIGIAISAVVNFLISDRYVFRAASRAAVPERRHAGSGR